MNGIIKIMIGVLTLMLTSFILNILPKEFTELLGRANMVFETPKEFQETKIIENQQMNYEYAIKSSKKNFEIRFAIRPLDSTLKEYQEKKNKKGNIIIDPNKIYSTSYVATILNITGGHLSKINVFDKGAVKQEFNADWGATTFVEVSKEFGQDYKYCMFVTIHKDNFGDAYIFFLSDSKEDFDELAQPAFHALKFNP